MSDARLVGWLQGYQMMKNGKLYGSIIPADVHSLRVQNLSLGERVELQILALTEHPVGRGADPEAQLQQQNDSCKLMKMRVLAQSNCLL